MKSSITRALIALLFAGFIFNSNSAFAETKAHSETNSFWENNFQSGVTLKTFNKMKKGMLLSTVNKMVGFQGTVTYSSRSGGKLVQSLKWEGSEYRIITAVFVDNRMTNKYMANLD